MFIFRFLLSISSFPFLLHSLFVDAPLSSSSSSSSCRLFIDSPYISSLNVPTKPLYTHCDGSSFVGKGNFACNMSLERAQRLLYLRKILSCTFFCLAILNFFLASVEGLLPKILSATFEVQTLNVLRRHDNVNLEDNSTGSDVINLAPATLQAIGIEVRYDQPIFAKFGFRKPKKRKVI